jgi:ABC-type nitrate/sulfonate/bicarbonate transport system substrate-binding protein
MTVLRLAGRDVAAFAILAGMPVGFAQCHGTLNVATMPIAAQTDVYVAPQRGVFAKTGLDTKITQFALADPAIKKAEELLSSPHIQPFIVRCLRAVV